MSTKTGIEVKTFLPQYQARVEELVLPIQNDEMGVKISKDEQPDLQDVQEYFQHDRGNFWVALDGARVVGTVGIVDIGNGLFALRKMFVDSNYRGKEKGVAHALLQNAFDWCKQSEGAQIFLGTTDKYLAAHRFYEKNGFTRLAKEDLPKSFPLCHVDTIFFQIKV